jgi:Uncharacterised nucleotidyltransferase
MIHKISILAQPRDAAETSVSGSGRCRRLQVMVQCLTQKTGPQDLGPVLKDMCLAATRHRVYPLFYPLLLSDPTLSSTDRQMLQRSLHENTVQSLTSFAELTRLLNVLHQAGYDRTIAFKGPVLSQLAYGNLSSRVFRDLDLLLLREDYLRVKPLLEAEGYHSVIDAQPTSLVQQEETCWAMGEYAMVNVEKGVWLDIHCELVGRDIFAVDLDLDCFFDQAQPLNCHGRSVLTFSPEYTLLHLCINSAKDYWATLQSAQDLMGLISRHPDLDWVLIVSEAKRLKIQRLMLISLLIARSYFGDRAELPLGLESDGMARWVATRILKRQRSDLPLGSVNRVLCRLGAIETWRLRLAYLMIFPSRVLRIVFAANQRDLRFVQLPPALRFLYVVIRPFRLVVQYGIAGLKGLF